MVKESMVNYTPDYLSISEELCLFIYYSIYLSQLQYVRFSSVNKTLYVRSSIVILYSCFVLAFYVTRFSGLRCSLEWRTFHVSSFILSL